MPQDHANLPAIVQPTGVDTYRQSTNAAEICGAIVKSTAMNIQGRKYVRCEGWQAIAVAHGCTASAGGVEFIPGGCRAVGQIRRMTDGIVIAEAEGFVGEDEPTWYGGQSRGKTLPKRPDFAIRAMAQTRAISRACRSAFAHVVVMIDRDLGTTPAEEMQGVYDHEEAPPTGPRQSSENGRRMAESDPHLVDNNRPKGTMAAGKGDALRLEPHEAPRPKFSAAEQKAKDWASQAKGTLNLSDQTKAALNAFWKENQKQIEWLENNMPDEYESLLSVFDQAMDRAAAKAA